MITYIDIQNLSNVLCYLVSHFQRLGWTVNQSAFSGNPNWKDYPNETARFFTINYETKTFSWQKLDKAGSNGLEDMCVSIEDADAILEFVKQNQDSFKEVPQANLNGDVYLQGSIQAPVIKEIATLHGKTYPEEIEIEIKPYGTYNQYSEYYDEVKQLAKDINIPLIVASQKKSKNLMDIYYDKIIQKYEEDYYDFYSKDYYKSNLFKSLYLPPTT